MKGFTYYDTIPVIPEPTIPEIIAGLSSAQKGKLLQGFTILGRTAYRLVANRLAIDEKAVDRLFGKMDEMEANSRSLMRGEVIVTPEVVDPDTGEVTTPAVYNTPPADSGELLTTIQDDFSDDFTSGQVTAVLTKMVKYSKHDGSGNWNFYKNNVIL